MLSDAGRPASAPASRRVSLFERDPRLFALHHTKLVGFFEEAVGSERKGLAWESAKSLAMQSSCQLDFEPGNEAPVVDTVDQLHVKVSHQSPSAAASKVKLREMLLKAHTRDPRDPQQTAAEKIAQILKQAKQPPEPVRGAHVGEKAWHKNTAIHALSAFGAPKPVLRLADAGSGPMRSSNDPGSSAKPPQFGRGSSRAQLLARTPAHASSPARQQSAAPARQRPAAPARQRSRLELSTRRLPSTDAKAPATVGASGRLAPRAPRRTAAIGISELLPLDAGSVAYGREELLDAGRYFNERHASRALHARGVMGILRAPPRLVDVPLEAEHAFNRAATEVFRNRLVVPETYDPFEPPKRAGTIKRRHQRWHIDGSIWFGRKKYGNSRDYYENERARRDMFEADWHMAHQGHGLAKDVERTTSQGPNHEHIWLDSDNNGVHDSVDATKEALWQHHELLYRVFDYYCTIYGSKRTASGEYDIFNMNLNAFTEFCRDCGLDERLSMSTLTQIWSQVNAEELKTAHLDVFNRKHQLNRHEFLQTIVRIAIGMYLGRAGTRSAGEQASTPKQSHAATVSDAVTKLCADILREAPPECHQDSNEFRRHRCYNEYTDAALRAHEGSLRRIFEVYAACNRDKEDKLQRQSLMSAGEWCAFLQHLGLFDSGQVSLFGAHMTFKWSIIRTAHDYGVASLSKLRNMMFEDFLEALVRLACVLALPTDMEVRQAGAGDAGEFFLELLHGGTSTEIRTFVDTRRVAWLHEPRQAVHRCVAHLLSLIVRTVERNISRSTSGGANMIIDCEEAQQFAARRQQGKELTSIVGRAGLLDSIRAAASIVRARLLEALQHVDILQGLDSERLSLLADAMADAQYDYDDYIFEQDDEGDTFYVLIEGSATVVRRETNAFGKEEECVLAELSTGMVFGERALLKKQTRYAGVRVDSLQLHCVSITRADFELALGGTLEEFVPDKYKLDRAELLRSLHTVRLFGSLGAEQITAMVDAMTEEHFPQGEYVFREADDGDVFYVILSGTASVLKMNNEGGEDELAQLGQWACFGERALLKDEVRYASICATSRELSCLRISRDDLEDALGQPPKDVLREQVYKAKSPAKLKARGNRGSGRMSPAKSPGKRGPRM